MNFPHKSLASDSGIETASEADQATALRALLAHAVARQSLSSSARAFAASRIEGLESVRRVHGQSQENRVRFFAGQLSLEKENINGEYLFVRGHFRPDIADAFLADSSA